MTTQSVNRQLASVVFTDAQGDCPFDCLSWHKSGANYLGESVIRGADQAIPIRRSRLDDLRAKVEQ